MPNSQQNKFEMFCEEIVADRVFWSGGSAYPWEGEALTDPSFLEDILTLAFAAPQSAKDTILAKLKGERE